jgi:hypothetical protein
MTEIPASADVAKMIVGGSPPIFIVGPGGERIGKIAPLSDNESPSELISDEEWAEIRRRMADDDGTRYTWDQVKEHLRSLAPE